MQEEKDRGSKGGKKRQCVRVFGPMTMRVVGWERWERGEKRDLLSVFFICVGEWQWCVLVRSSLLCFALCVCQCGWAVQKLWLSLIFRGWVGLGPMHSEEVPMRPAPCVSIVLYFYFYFLLASFLPYAIAHLYDSIAGVAETCLDSWSTCRFFCFFLFLCLHPSDWMARLLTASVYIWWWPSKNARIQKWRETSGKCKTNNNNPTESMNEG